MNNATFQGLRTIAPGGNASLTWSVSVDEETTGSAGPTLPDLFAQTLTSADNANAWYLFTLDPQGVQASFTFGTCLSLQVSITRLKSWIVDDTSLYIVGRVFIYIPSTGQYFVFTPRQVMTEDVSGAVAVLESTTDIVPISLADGAKMQLWLESDIGITADAPAIAAPSSCVAVSLFNFALPPASVS